MAGDKTPRPERPDQAEFKKQDADLTEKLEKVQNEQKLTRQKLSPAGQAKGTTGSNDRQAELQKELKSLIAKQNESRNSKKKVFEEIQRADDQVQKKIKDLQAAKSRIGFKNVADLDRHIQSLESQVESGSLKLVEEKKTLNEISSLKKAKRSFGTFAEAQEAIDQERQQVAELRKKVDDKDTAENNARFKEITAELDSLRAENKKTYDQRSKIREELDKLQKERDEIFQSRKELRDTYYSKKNAYDDFVRQEQKRKQEQYKAEKKARESEKRKRFAAEKLEEAATPAYATEINTAENLISFFNRGEKPLPPGTVSANAISGPATTSAPEGMKVFKREEEPLFAPVKKNTKKKTAANQDKLVMGYDILEDLGKLKISPPLNKEGVPTVVKELEDKIKWYKENQDRQTKENIAQAKAALEKLEAGDKEKDKAQDAITDSAKGEVTA